MHSLQFLSHWELSNFEYLNKYFLSEGTCFTVSNNALWVIFSYLIAKAVYCKIILYEFQWNKRFFFSFTESKYFYIPIYFLGRTKLFQDTNPLFICTWFLKTICIKFDSLNVCAVSRVKKSYIHDTVLIFFHHGKNCVRRKSRNCQKVMGLYSFF